jgi:type II secretory pathway component PulF
LGTAFEKEEVFPRLVSGMILIGESSGSLDATLLRIGESSSRDLDNMVRVLVGLIEPTIILVMGLMVAFIVAAVIIPIFQVNLAM